MARRKSETLTDREAEIMDVLWKKGTATADQTRALLHGRPHDSTVRTLLRVLEEKGHVKHDVEGRTYVYRPVIRRDSAQKRAVKKLLRRFFGGSSESLVIRLLEDEQITADELRELARTVAKTRT